MSQLPFVSSERVIRSLLKAGLDYAPIKGKGSHIALVREEAYGVKFLVIIPKRNPLPKGTLITNIKQSGYSIDEFIKLIS